MTFDIKPDTFLRLSLDSAKLFVEKVSTREISIQIHGLKVQSLPGLTLRDIFWLLFS